MHGIDNTSRDIRDPNFVVPTCFSLLVHLSSKTHLDSILVYLNLEVRYRLWETTHTDFTGSNKGTSLLL